MHSFRFLSTTSFSAHAPRFAAGILLLIGAGVFLCAPQVQAQQPEPETVFDHLKEEGQMEQLPPSLLQEKARRDPASLSLDQLRRLRRYQMEQASAFGARSKAGGDQFQVKDPVQSNGAVAWPREDLNFRPGGTAQRAGDVDGDGVNDYIYVNTRVADDRSSTLSERTSKTLLKFGGGGDFSSSFFDELYYRNLQPVGNFVGSDNADAIEIRRTNYRILEGTSSGYSEVARKPALPNRVTAARMAPVDLDGDGFDDVVFPSRTDSTITVLYGASDPANVERRTYSPFFDGFESFSHATGNVDSTTSSDDEIVRVAGRTDTTATIPQDSLTIAVFDVDGSRALVKDTTFRTAPLEDIQSELGGDIGSVRAENLATRIVNVDGTDLQEIILQEQRLNQFTVAYTEVAGGDTYDNTALSFPARVNDVGDLNGDDRGDFYLPADTAIALGPATVSDGLTPDASVPQSTSEQINLFDFPDTQLGNRLGDVNGDGDNEFIAEFGGTSQFGVRLLDFSSGSLSGTDFAFDESTYRLQGVVTTRNIGDWNGDGTDDVAFVFQDGRVELYFGDPAESLSADLTLTTDDQSFGQPTASVAAGDFTGNGERNLAVGWRSNSQTIAVYEAGAGASPIHTVGIEDLGISATATGLNDSPQDRPFGVVRNVGDVNADDIDDLAAAVPNARTPAATAAFLFLGQSSLSGSPDVTIDYSDDGASISVGSAIEALGDINDDGIDDFAVADIERPVTTSQGSAQGGIYVHFGQDAGTPSFGAPDEIITPQPKSQEQLLFFPLNIASGDFNGDGTPDLAAMPAFFRMFNFEPVEAIRIHEGGAFFGGAPEQKLFLPGFLEADTQFEFATSNIGELTTVPPEAGAGADRLMVETFSPTNALVFSPTQASAGVIESGTLLRAPDQNDGLGTSSNFIRLPNGESSGIGDLNGDGQLETILPQPENANFLGAPAYTYPLGATGGDVTEAQPVAAETSRLDASRIELGTETGSFRAPRVTVEFSAKGSGEGDVTVGRYTGRPFEAGTVDQENVSLYYVRVGVEQDSDETDNVIGDSSRVRFDVSVLPGISDPNAVTIYQRELPDAGPFTALPTTYDAGANELVAENVSRPGEFVFASDDNSLTRTVATPRRLSATAASDSVTVNWEASADADQYFVYRSTSPIEWAAGPSGRTPFDTTAAGTTSFIDTTAQVGKTFYYRVTAATSDGTESGFSPQSQARRTFVLGSPSGDEAVTAGDASLVRQFSVGLINFDPGQQLAGDVSGDGTVNAADASLIQQFIVGLIDTFPADTAKAQAAPLADVRGTVDWGEPTETGEGRTEVPIRLIDEPSNVRSVQFRATYDTSAVRVADVKTGDLPAGWQALHNVEKGSGTIRIALAGTEPAGAGPLATLVLESTSGGGSAELSGQAALYTASEKSVGTVSVERAPQSFRVEANYPNPFREKTTIEYALPERTSVKIAVYDLLGRRVRTLVNERQGAGQHAVTLKAASLSSGTYFYRVQTEASTETGRMVIVR